MTSGLEQVDWYDLPLYYDIVFEEDTVVEADFLDEMHRRHGKTRGRRGFEPACGGGRLLAELDGRGWQLVGLDGNPNMLRFAEERKRERRCRYRLVEGRLEQFDVPGSFDLAYCLVSTFKYLLTEEDAASHLRSVARVLKPGGIYVLGLHLAEYGTTVRTRERWVGRRGPITVTSNLQTWPPDRDQRIEAVRVRLKVEEAGIEPKRFETHWTFRTYSAPELTDLLESVLEFEHVATHDFNYDPARVIPLDGNQLDTVLILRRRRT